MPSFPSYAISQGRGAPVTGMGEFAGSGAFVIGIGGSVGWRLVVMEQDRVTNTAKITVRVVNPFVNKGNLIWRKMGFISRPLCSRGQNQ